MSVSLNSKPGLIHLHSSNNTCRYPQKRAKKSKSGLHDNWVERTRFAASDDDWETQSGTQSVESMTVHSRYARSRSSVLSATGSSRPTTQPTSGDEDEGGITDDAGEMAEHKNLSGKPPHLERLKTYYGGKSKVSGTGVIIGTRLYFTSHGAHLQWSSPTVPRFSPHCPHYFGSHLRQAKHKLPCCCFSRMAQKG